MKTAIFPGSFNPFTIGHKSIVDRGLQLFDRVIIAVGYNIRKDGHEQAEERAKAIRSIFSDNKAVEVESYSGLTVDFYRKKHADAILRGIRDISDFEYERRMADINRRIAGAETVMLIADPELGCVSSSMVRELDEFGYDISQFLP